VVKRCFSSVIYILRCISSQSNSSLFTTDQKFVGQLTSLACFDFLLDIVHPADINAAFIQNLGECAVTSRCIHHLERFRINFMCVCLTSHMIVDAFETFELCFPINVRELTACLD